MDIDGKLQRVGMQKDELRAHIEIHRDGIYCRHNLADKETGTDMDGPAETSRQIDKQGGRAGRASTKAVERGGGGRTAGAQGRLFFESTRDQRGRLHGGAGGGTRCYRRARGRGGKGGGGMDTDTGLARCFPSPPARAGEGAPLLSRGYGSSRRNI